MLFFRRFSIFWRRRRTKQNVCSQNGMDTNHRRLSKLTALEFFLFYLCVYVAYLVEALRDALFLVLVFLLVVANVFLFSQPVAKMCQCLLILLNAK